MPRFRKPDPLGSGQVQICRVGPYCHPSLFLTAACVEHCPYDEADVALITGPRGILGVFHIFP